MELCIFDQIFVTKEDKRKQQLSYLEYITTWYCDSLFTTGSDVPIKLTQHNLIILDYTEITVQ